MNAVDEPRAMRLSWNFGKTRHKGTREGDFRVSGVFVNSSVGVYSVEIQTDRFILRFLPHYPKSTDYVPPAWLV